LNDRGILRLQGDAVSRNNFTTITIDEGLYMGANDIFGQHSGPTDSKSSLAATGQRYTTGQHDGVNTLGGDCIGSQRITAVNARVLHIGPDLGDRRC